MKLTLNSLTAAVVILAVFMLLSSIFDSKAKRLTADRVIENIHAIKALEAQVVELESKLSEKATEEQSQ